MNHNMYKKLVYLVVATFALYGSLLYAQDTTKLNPVLPTIGDGLGTPDAPKQGINRPSGKKKSGHSDSVEVDSMQIMKDSIAKLNELIAQLQKQNSKNLHNNTLQIENNNLKQEVNRLNNIITGQIVGTFGKRISESTANNFFCFSVMESPLYYNYDKHRVEQSLNTAKAMGYDMPEHKFNWIYNIYYDLLKNYEVYNRELIQNINKIIEQFSYVTPNREMEKQRFEDRLATSKYYKTRGKGKYGTYRHIFYLDFQIEQVRELFKSNANFKKEKFLEVRDAL